MAYQPVWSFDLINGAHNLRLFLFDLDRRSDSDLLTIDEFYSFGDFDEFLASHHLGRPRYGYELYDCLHQFQAYKAGESSR